MTKSILILFLFFTNCISCISQDILGSTIKISNSSINFFQRTIEISLNIDTSSSMQRVNLWVTVGNGDSVMVPYVSTTTTAFNYRIEKFSTTYTYFGSGIFTLHFSDSSWVNNVINFSQNNNDYFQNLDITVLPIFETPNIAPLINDAIPLFIMDSIGVYHSNISSADIDSNNILYFKETCWVNGYSFPNELFVDSISGDISFKPLSTGQYAISVKVKETENGGIIPINEHLKTFVVNIPQTIASIEQKQEVNTDFTIFPNPTNDLLNIKFVLLKDCKINIQLINSLGQIVKEVSNKQASGAYTLTVDTKQFSKGIYNIRFFDGLNSNQAKVVIQ